jgi:uracil-DNA glycosylase
MKVLFIGSNPSVKSATYNPFCPSTKSGKILNNWVNQTCSGKFVSYANISDNQTQANRPLSSTEIKENLPRLKDKITAINPWRIVALGKAAEKALTLLHCNFYAMPHPSGLNRQLNDPKFVEEKIKGLREYLKPSEEELFNPKLSCSQDQ